MNIQGNLPPPCGGVAQVNQIVQLIRETNIPKLNNLVSVRDFNSLPKEIKKIYNIVVNLKPIAQGGFKIGIWNIPPHICSDKDNFIIKIETNDDTDANIKCVAYWLNEQLELEGGNRHPRLAYYCKSLFIEMYLNAICDVLYRDGYMSGILGTPRQYYVDHFNPQNLPAGIAKPWHSVVTIQDKISGDVMNLLTYQQEVNIRGDTPNPHGNLLDYTYLINYITQISWNLYSLQELLKFRHNDFWIRNCYIHNYKPGDNVMMGNVDLNQVNYYEYTFPNGTSVFLRNVGMLMKISDFGWSRFETATVIMNNKQWMPPYNKIRGFGWGNNIDDARYVDLLTQICGWIKLVFVRDWYIDGSAGFDDWLNVWEIDFTYMLAPATDIVNIQNEHVDWLKSVLFLVLFQMAILIGETRFNQSYSPSNANITALAQDILGKTRVAVAGQAGFTNVDIYHRIAREISQINIDVNGNRTINDVFASRYRGITYVHFLTNEEVHDNTGQKHRCTQLRIPQHLDYDFNFKALLERFLLYSVQNCGSTNIVSTVLPAGNTKHTFNIDRINPLYDNDNLKEFFKLRESKIDRSLPQGMVPLEMRNFRDIPYTIPTKAREIGGGIQVYEFVTKFSPLGLHHHKDQNRVFEGYPQPTPADNNPPPDWVQYNPNQKQYINVVKIPKSSFDQISLNLYHYNPPKTLQQKQQNPKKTLSNILGNIPLDQTGVVMAGDYFNYRNWSKNPATDRYEVQGRCTPPTCDSTIGIVRTDGRDPIIEDEKPLPIYKEFFGLVCFKTTTDGDLLDNVSISSYNNINANQLFDCNMILSGSPTMGMGGTPSFLDEMDNYAKSQGMTRRELVQYFAVQNPANENPRSIIGGQGIHFFSANPRSAIGVTAGGDLLLVTVEGRGYRGSGVDILQLEKVMCSLGCISSLNIDGGGTSDILYKPENQLPSVRVNTNPAHKFVSVDQNGDPISGLYPSTALTFIHRKPI